MAGFSLDDEAPAAKTPEMPAEAFSLGDEDSNITQGGGHPVSTAADMAQSAPGGAALGVGDVAGSAGTFGDLYDKAVRGVYRGAGHAGEWAGIIPKGKTEEFLTDADKMNKSWQSPSEQAGNTNTVFGVPMMTSAGAEHAIRKYAPGIIHDPETEGGKVAQQVARFGAGAIAGAPERIASVAAEAPTLARSILAGGKTVLGQGAKGAITGGVAQGGADAAQKYIGMDPSDSSLLQLPLAVATHKALGSFGKSAPVEPPPGPAEVGSRLRTAASEAKQGVDAAYGRASSNPGYYNGISFDPQNPQTGSPTSIMWQRANEHMYNEPGFPHGTFEVADDLEPVRRAQEVLNRHMGELNGQPHTVNDLETTRRDLSRIANHPDTSSTASHHIGNLIRGFDAGRQEAAATPGFFTGDGAQVSRDIAAARNAHSQYMDNYGASAPAPVRNAVNRLGAGDNIHVDDPALNESAGNMLAASLKHPSNGPMTYGHLQGTPIAPHVNEFLRGQLLSGTPEEVTRNLAHPNAARVFSPAEIRKAQSLNKGTLASKAVHNVIAPTAGALGASYAATHGAGLFGTAAADFVGKNTANFVGNALAPKGNLYDRLHAPPQPIDWGPAANIGALADRSTHARGGKVSGHQHLVDRLFTHIEKAKKAEKSRTSVLLRQPDEHIAKALNVAQAAI
jgi:hypothetical protein